MNEQVLAAIRDGAKQLAGECESRVDALEYVDQLAESTNADLALGYETGSDSYGVLYKACYSAIWEATKHKS